MLKIFFTWVIILKICSCQVDPDEYIINVHATCPQTIYTGPATVTISTDLPSSKPFATCQNGDFLFTTHPMGNWSLDVYFDKNITRECVFGQKHNAAEIFSISVYVPLSDNVLTINVPEKIVNCIYDPIGDQFSDMQQLEDSNKPVKQITQHKATPSTSKINICIADVSGNCIQGSVRIGKKVMIKAILLSNSALEQGFQTLTCTAIGTGYRYPMLLGGCGDGNLIPKDLGFTTVGTVATSPLFKAFRVPGGNTLTYDCSFVICSVPCDGSSCNVTGNARKKRDTSSVRDPSFRDTIHIPKDKVLETNAGDRGKVTSVRKTSSQNPSHDAPLLQEIHPIKPTILNRDDKESQEMEHSSKNRKNEPSQNEPSQNEPSQNEHQNAPIIKETDPIQSNILKEEREKNYLSLWTMETLVLLLAILIIVFMAVTVRMLLLLTKSVGQLQNLPAVKHELFPGSKLMS